MIVVEYPYNNNENRIKHYSDDGKLIRQVETGAEYAEAIDVYPCSYTYEETDKDIEISEEEPTREELIEALNELGVNI